jgi:hypothetical protein
MKPDERAESEGTRPEDKPLPWDNWLPEDQQSIYARYPELKKLV